MRNFKKLVPRICAVIAFILLTNWVITLGYETWSNAVLHSKRERTQMKGTIDTVYAGVSLVYCAYDWEILDEELGTNSFNLATSRQPMKGSYYLIRETVEENPVKQVYLGLSIPSLKQEADESAYLSAANNLRSLRWKLKYLLSVGSESVAMDSLFVSTTLEYYDNLQRIKTNAAHKLLYPEVLPKGYGGRGFRLYDEVYDGGENHQNSEDNYWDGSQGLSQAWEESLEYLEKIGEFCAENDIELIITVMPLTQDYIDGAGDMDAFDSACRTLAEECGAQYYNFILYKDREKVFTDDKFWDRKHMNVAGAEAFSELLAEIRQSEDPDSYFYDSMTDFTGQTEEMQ